MAKKVHAKRGGKSKRTTPKIKVVGDSPEILDIPVSFGGVSIGKTTAKVGVRVTSEHFNDDDAHQFLVDSRLAVSMHVDPMAKKDVKGQQSLAAWTAKAKMKGVADVKGYSANTAGYSFGLTFMRAEINDGDLAAFSNRDGKVSLTKTGSAGGDAPAGGDDADDPDQMEISKGGDDAESDTEPDSKE